MDVAPGLAPTPRRSPTRPSGSTCRGASDFAGGRQLSARLSSSRASLAVAVAVVDRRRAGRRMTIWSASIRTRDLALPGPVLGVDGVVLDRGVEPEAVAVGFAVVEGRLELFAPAAATAAAAARRRGAGGPAPRRRLGLAVAVAVILVVLGLASASSSASASASSAVAASISASISSRRSTSPVPALVLVGGEPVLFAELAQLRGADLELVGDPGVGAALAHPGADLVELGLQ